MDKELLKKFIQGKCTREESQNVMSWFDTQGEEKFLELVENDWHSWEEETSEEGNQLKHILGKIHTRISEKELNLVHKEKQIPNTRTTYKPYSYRKYSLAAVISLLLIAGVAFVIQFSNTPKVEKKVELKRKKIPLGQKATIYLSDGTKVMLNAGSSISYPEKFSKTSREVSLEGEAFFEVVEDKIRPFSVISGDITTTALGTSFNVNAYQENDHIEVALASGKVLIKDNNKEVKRTVLAPGELLNLDLNTGNSNKENFNVKEKLGWTESLLYFNDAGAKEVFSTLKRWYGVEFTFNREMTEKWKYSGEFKNKSLETVLKGISYVKDFDFVFRDGKHIDVYFK
ncbi:FecR domain-containing protein [Fulvivirgaceae bacterium BMA10]|uniref:FecR domain-containing protein n=1 Tax=Splendidivirga corallicola TaxID=3051826 RepID=A0ABT8KR80_9BACT|nr:FecR domain-containing protein [Fulvivirgaceae bacterium BMA10]